jgi:hypothetical protein
MPIMVRRNPAGGAPDAGAEAEAWGGGVGVGGCAGGATPMIVPPKRRSATGGEKPTTV